ncbi:MAG TPA: DUF995 domain-containing protein [Rhodocyclaceae bacterium]|nr:DUF995 domain-containing protein [Rhodocyclaceae bacterium]
MAIGNRNGSGFVSRYSFLACVSFVLPGVALAEPPTLFGDLEPLSPEKLSREQLEQLMTGAKMSQKVASTGSTRYWTNDKDGAFVISSDNRGALGGVSYLSTGAATAPGKWHISPDGRYCVTIEWKKIPTEDWCRYVFKTTEGYFGSRSDTNRAEKVFRLWINGN